MQPLADHSSSAGDAELLSRLRQQGMVALRSIRPSGRVLVAMSSIPSRLPLIGPALESILNQSRPPDEIVVSLPYYSLRDRCSYEVPPCLSDLASDGRVTLSRTDTDYGPGTKLLGALPHVRVDDVVVILDDDNRYRPFVLGDLYEAISDGSVAASFYVYENRGLLIGQGADGFAMMGAAALRCAGGGALIRSHPVIRMHDDVWVSFMLQREGVTIKGLGSLLTSRGADRAYVPVHSVNGLAEQGGEMQRSRLLRQVVSVLYRHGDPTPEMRVQRALGYVRGLRRRIGRLSVANPTGRPA